MGGTKYGIDYLRSDAFEKYADQSKAPWTCQLENAIGDLHIVMSEYRKGYFRFSHTVSRCSDTQLAQDAEFQVARCLEGMALRNDAVAAYEAFAKKYPENPRARSAARSAQILRGL